ncbi:methyltransferase family protein [Chloroflexota bacterium]
MPETEKAASHGTGRPTETDTGTSHGSENLKPPNLFAWLASLATVSLIPVNLFLPQGGNPYLRAAGVVLLVLASVFVFAPFFLLRKHGRTRGGETYMQTNTLVDQGLYAITRHPQYLGYKFFVCGFALLSQQPIALLLAAVAVTFFYLQAVKEEHYCLAQLGEPYEQYLGRVPRFNIVLGIIRLVHS